MTRRFTLLVNPTSGGGAAPRVAVPLARRLREADAAVEIGYTSSPAAVPALVEEAVARGDVVVSVGGDGMLASVAGEVAARDGVLAVVPAGRGNDFARMLALPTEEPALAALLLDGEPASVDLLAVDAPGRPRRVFAGSLYAGVDARAAAIVDRTRRIPSRLQYPLAAVRALATYRPVVLALEVDGDRTEHLAANVVVANSRFYGSGMAIAPAADVADGVLDVVVIEAASRAALLRSFPKVYDGAHVDLPEVTVLRGRSVRLLGRYAGGDDPVPVGADGEPVADLPLAGDPLAVEVLPAAVRIIR